MRLPGLFLLLLALLLGVGGAGAGPDTSGDGSALAAFQARHGDAWSLIEDPRTGRPRRLVGGALPLAMPADAVDHDVAAATHRFLSDHADLLGLRPEDLGPGRVLRAGSLVTVHHEFEPAGVRLVGGRATVALSRGRLLAVHLVGARSEGVTQDAARPRFFDAQALAAGLAATALTPDELSAPPSAELVFEAEAQGLRLLWQVTVVRRSPPARFIVRLDARDGDLIEVRDETVEICDPPAGAVAGRVTGGVRPESAGEPERVELLPFVSVGAVAAGVDGVFTTPPPPFTGRLQGATVAVSCTGCVTPVAPSAPSLPNGDLDFGVGGVDETGNGFSTPSGRAAYFHVDGARRLATRWTDQPFLAAPLNTRVNVDSACNANWDGSGLNFFRSSATCGNTGEIRDVISHEWGHAFDDNDGLRASPLSVDAATGEAVGDTIAILRSHDACIGEGFFLSPARWPSDACSGVRDLDEKAAGHRRGAPATLSLDNVESLCPPSGYYRGPLGREGHCEGEILGQAIWHLVQNLQDGVSYDDGSPLPDAGLGEDTAFEVVEALFFRSRALLASYAPTSHQGIGMSAYEAFLLADDEGDGLANGTPHAAAIHEAFAHHGLTEGDPAPPDTAPLAGPGAPVLTATQVLDSSLGRPAIALGWTDVGAQGYRVLRADDAGDAWLTLADLPGGTLAHVDRGVLVGRSHRYRIEARDAADNRSSSPEQALSAGGPEIVIAALALDDSPAAGGDGDGLFEEGESAELRVDLLNVGDAPASVVDVSLRATDPALVIVDPGPIDYGMLPPGVVVPGPSVFTLRADAGVPRQVFLVVDADAVEGCLRTQIQWESASPELEIAAERLDDADADGTWTPGESADLWIDLQNVGLVDAAPVDGTLRFRGAPVPGITLDTDLADWGTVGAGGGAVSSAAPFQLTAAPGLGPRTKVPLELELRIGGTVHAVHAVDLTVGGFEPGELEWSWDHTGDQLTMLELTPLVLQLTDDDGDGLVSECDVPDVVIFTTPRFGTGPDEITMRALSGDTGLQHWELNVPCTQVESSSAQAGGDIDGDGFNEILVGGEDEFGEAFICAISHDGAVEWRTSEPVHASSQFRGRATPQVWDLEGDGEVEVIAGHTVIEGATGAVLWTHDRPSAPRSLVVDLDLDGRLEVIQGPHVYDADGTELPLTLGNWFGLKPGAVGNLDADREPELVLESAAAGLYVVNHDGTPLWERPDLAAGGSAGPTCLGDVDGDGLAEVGLPTRETFYLLDDDGQELWSRPVGDLSGAAGCSLFDFEEDGEPEVIYRDHDTMWVFDGEDGTILWETTVRSGTAFEYPIVADVDHDGSAEILVLDGLSLSNVKLRAFGNPSWPRARGVWNQEDYSVSNVGEAGEIPALPAPRWLAGNDYRAQVQGPDTTCLCNRPDGSILNTHPDCVEPLACFALDPSGGLAPFELSWDFGDGSPPSTDAAPCHQYPSWGSYGVTVRVRDANGCETELSRLVVLREPLAVDFTAGPTCTGVEDCYVAMPSGGRAPIDISWDFGDGSPLVPGATACHLFATGGSRAVTVFARDADGCLAEATVDVAVGDVGGLPELSAAGATPLLLTRAAPGMLSLSFEDLGFPAGLHAGTLAGLWAAGPDHDALACNLAGGTASIAEPMTDSYFLAVATGECGGTPFEGPYGLDSFGSARPTSPELGNSPCP